jgi:hypothetical protein
MQPILCAWRNCAAIEVQILTPGFIRWEQSRKHWRKHSKESMYRWLIPWWEWWLQQESLLEGMRQHQGMAVAAWTRRLILGLPDYNKIMIFLNGREGKHYKSTITFQKISPSNFRFKYHFINFINKQGQTIGCPLRTLYTCLFIFSTRSFCAE